MRRALFIAVGVVLLNHAAIAAPFNDPDGRYTLEVPEPWSVADVSHGPIFPIMRSGDEFRESQILVSVTNPAGTTLDAELSVTVGRKPLEKVERTVAGAPCLYAKWTMRAGHMGDVLICSITTTRYGKKTDMRFSITSDGDEAIYAQQHGIFEMIVQSVKWHAGTTAGPR